MSCMLILATQGLASGCGSSPKIRDQAQINEIPAQRAKVGDVLITTDDVEVVLTAPFKPNQPNGLYDGGVKIKSTSKETTHHEVNAICSMPGLEGWPDYDNIYGKTINSPSDAGQEGGNTEWQNIVTCCKSCNTKKGSKAVKPIIEPKKPSFAHLLNGHKLNRSDFPDKSWADYIF